MKKIIIFLIISIYGACYTNAQTISIHGYIRNNQTNIGISNHAVQYKDSINNITNTIYTNTSGYYAFNVNILDTVVNKITVKTLDCQNYIHSTMIFVDTNSHDSTINFSICDSIQNCTNSFTYTHQNLSYNFSGSNLSTFPTNYFWIFGDGGTATGQNVGHTFQEPPYGVTIRTVTLYTQTLIPNNTCFSQTSQEITIFGNDSIIGGTATCGNLNLNTGKVLLYGINNPVGTCSLIDSTNLSSNGFYYFNNFHVGYTGYIIKAQLPENSPLSNLYIPTYYDSSYSWVNSPPVFPFINSNSYNIHLIPFITDTIQGVGTISGNISILGSKNKENNSISNIDVLLINQNNKPIKLTRTDVSGNYVFSNLKNGIYKVFVEIVGKIPTPANITISNANPVANNINFIITENTISLLLNEPTSIINYISEIYPNPAKDNISIDFNTNKSCKTIISIYNQFGQKVFDNNYDFIEGKNNLIIETNKLKEGFYTLQMKINSETVETKKFVKLN